MEVYVGLDLSRKRLDWQAVDGQRQPLAEGAITPDREGLARLVLQFGSEVVGVIESMNGARFVHDQLELAGWDVRIADAQRVKGLGAAGLQDRSHRRAGAGRAGRVGHWCRRSGCPIRGCGPSGSWRAFACIWSSNARC